MGQLEDPSARVPVLFERDVDAMSFCTTVQCSAVHGRVSWYLCTRVHGVLYGRSSTAARVSRVTFYTKRLFKAKDVVQQRLT